MGIIIRQSLKGTIVTYIGSFIGFLTTMFIVTKYLTQEELGLTRVLFDAASFLAALAMLGVPSSIVKFFPYFKDETKKNNGFFFYITLIPLFGIIFFFTLFLVLKNPISHYFSENSSLFVQYYYWVIPLAFFIIYWSIFEIYDAVLMRITVPKIVREILVRVLLIILYLSYAFGLLNIDGFVAGYVAIYGVAMLAVFFYTSKIGPVSLQHDQSYIDKPLKKHFLSYTGIIILGSLGGSIITKIDVFMISASVGLASTGVYTIALFMAAVIEIPARSMNAISTPIASNLMKENNVKEVDVLYKKVSLHQLLIGSFIFLMIWINIDNIYAIIPNGEDYIAGKWAFLFLGIARLTEITFNFGASLIQYSKYYYWSTIFIIFLSLLTVLTNYLLIPIWGVAGSAIATAITCFVSYTLQQFIIFRKIKVNPFSKSTVKILLVLSGLFIINYFLPAIDNPWVDACYRTILIGGVSIFFVYFLHISEEVERLVVQIIQRIKRKK